MAVTWLEDVPSLEFHRLNSCEWFINRTAGSYTCNFLKAPFTYIAVIDATKAPILLVNIKNSDTTVLFHRDKIPRPFECNKCKKLFSVVYLRKIKWVCQSCGALTRLVTSDNIAKDLELAKTIICRFVPP